VRYASCVLPLCEFTGNPGLPYGRCLCFWVSPKYHYDNNKLGALTEDVIAAILNESDSDINFTPK
jgi:hypothetical protein